MTTTCPSCGGAKSPDAAVCRRCFPSTMGANARRAGAPLRSIDAPRSSRSDWRPAHLPPACTTCRGFGYVQHDRGAPANALVDYRQRLLGTGILARQDDGRDPRGRWHPCPDCVGHPGSCTSHAAWTERRGT